MDKNDDMGKPPFLPLDEMEEAEMEYVCQWGDFYLAKEPELVGYLTEFKNQQDIWKHMAPLLDRARKNARLF